LPAREAPGRDQFMFTLAADMFSGRARKFVTAAQKIFAEFNAIRFSGSVLQSGLDVNSSLQVETGNVFDSLAFDSDLHNHDHVTLFDSRISFRFELSSSPRILPNLVNDHVRHAFDHVKLSRKLPCTNAITSDFDRNFLAQTRSSHDPELTSGDSLQLYVLNCCLHLKEIFQLF
jgi:hypothetical protein